ncbi:MAG: rod shape-determining protein MreC [Oscillospiraceae bacterium]
MKDFLHSFKFKILVGLFAVIFGIMIYAATTGGKDSAVASFFGAVFSPFQKLSTSISQKVSSGIDKFVNADNYYEENQKLKEQLGEMYNQMVDYENIKEENQYYEEILELKEEYSDLKFSPPCKVIGRTTNDIYQSFFIDKGSRDGVSLHDPVITKDGIVGIVDDVELTFSRVTTILSSEYPIGAYCVRTKETGIVEGSFDYAELGFSRMKFINRESEMKTGDIIVSSGHSGLIPKDMIIGIVSELVPDSSGLSLIAQIKPIVELESLTNVFVIIEFEGQGEGYAD